jgi:hypothetical protein
MKTEERSIFFLTIIAPRKQKDAILTLMLDSGMHLIDSNYGTGTIKAHYLMKSFGLVPERSKIVINSISTEAKIDTVLQALTEKFNFGKPNTGIAFTTPVEQVSY